MDFQIKIDPQRSWLLIELTGRFDLDDLEKCYQTFLGRSDWKKGNDILWDVRACSFEHLNGNDMRTIAAMTENYRDQRGPGRAAWVTGRNVDFGIGRMYEMTNEKNVIYNFRVFRTIEEAEEWILKPDISRG